MGSDLSVVRAARVSHDAAWRAGEDEKSDTKLIRFLWRNRHSTPFEAVTVTFEVQAPIFVFRQWHRHRTQSYNELSARYSELPTCFYVPERDAIGLQSTINKQGRTLTPGDASPLQRDLERSALHGASVAAFQVYHMLLAAGWPRELARVVLPLNTYSKMFATANLWNLLHFITLRSDPKAQYEIRVYADAMLELLRPIVPVTIGAFAE